MGREIRRVPKDWQHPMQPCPHSPWAGGCEEAHENGGKCYVPLFDGYTERLARWDREAAKWDEGLVYNWGHERGDGPEWKPKPTTDCPTFEDWDGARPLAEDYMPDWPAEQRTHLQMYETCSEGTPISPVMETPEALARWLADNGASAFGGETASYEAWLRVCRGGWAPSAIISRAGLQSGVEALADDPARG